MDRLNTYQIKVSKEMDKLLVETAIYFFHTAEDARQKNNTMTDSKGTTLSFDDKIKRLKDMYYGTRLPKSTPWAFCSNRSMKIAMAIIDLLHARLFPQVWNEDLIRWRPTEKTDKDKAERITKLMDWWERVYTSRRNFFDKWVKVCIGFGDSLTEGSWEVKVFDSGEETQTPITDEFGVQLYDKTGNPSIKKDKIFRFEEKSRFDIIPAENVYFQEGQTDIYEDPVIIKCRWTFAELETMEGQGKAVNVSKKTSEDVKTLRESLMVDINQTYSSNQQDSETIKEVKLRSTPVDILKLYIKADIDDDGFSEDIRILIDPLNRVYLGGVQVKDLTANSKRPLDFTKVNDLIEAPNLLKGYGYIEMVFPLAEEIDAIFNQITDANTLSVLRPGFYDPSGNVQPQTSTLAPNKLIPVPDPQRNIYFPDFQIPTERLMLAMRAVLEFIERLTAASAYILGKESEIVGGSGTATRTQAIVGAAEQRFAMPALRLREGAARILTTDLSLVQKNIPQGFETRVLGEDGEPLFGGNEISKEGISSQLDAYILEDPSLGSMDMERQLAMMMYNILLQNPIVNTDPVKIYNETANLLKSYGQDPEEHLGPAPEAKDIDTPEEENTLIIQGDFSKVRALLTENHIQHIASHKNLLMSPTLAMLNPMESEQVISFVNQHIQEHMMMMQQMLALTKMGGAGGQPGGTQTGQGNAATQGMGNIPGPFGKVAQTKEQGVSNPTPPM